MGVAKENLGHVPQNVSVPYFASRFDNFTKKVYYGLVNRVTSSKRKK